MSDNQVSHLNSAISPAISSLAPAPTVSQATLAPLTDVSMLDESEQHEHCKDLTLEQRAAIGCCCGHGLTKE